MITPLSATVEPMERSICPAMMTMVMPNAMTPFMDMLRKILAQFGQVKNVLEANVITTTSMMSSTSMM